MRNVYKYIKSLILALRKVFSERKNLGKQKEYFANSLTHIIGSVGKISLEILVPNSPVGLINLEINLFLENGLATKSAIYQT